ncbi:MAG: type III PLP-dependent enzyme [Actinomycetota bacterium]
MQDLLAHGSLSREPTPFFAFDLDRVARNYSRVRDAFGTEHVHYAVKANNQPTILTALRETGAKFEVGSQGEINLLQQLDVSAADIIFSAPVKLDSDIVYAYRAGVRLFVFDSVAELVKLATNAPGAQVLVRISVSSEGSMFPLNDKFGASPREAVTLLRRAGRAGLNPHGVAFHVGSQCERKETWVEAMETVLWVWENARDLPLHALNIGGGFPAAYKDGTPAVEDIASEVRAALSLFPRDIELVVEPGRVIVADAGVLVASVVGKARRDGKEWLYLDVGALNGLFEAVQAGRRFPFRVCSEKPAPPGIHYVLTGPTCDPDDTILEDVCLPEMDLRDRVGIMNVGAYSLVYASEFGGFPPPKVHFMLGDRQRARSL